MDLRDPILIRRHRRWLPLVAWLWVLGLPVGAQQNRAVALRDARMNAPIDSLPGWSAQDIMAHLRAHPSLPTWLVRLMRQGNGPMARATLDEMADSLEARGDAGTLAQISEGEIAYGGTPYPGVLDRLIHLVEQPHNAGVALHHMLHVGERPRAVAYVRSVAMGFADQSDIRADHALSALIEDGYSGFRASAAEREEALGVLHDLYVNNLVENRHAWLMLLSFAGTQAWPPPSATTRAPRGAPPLSPGDTVSSLSFERARLDSLLRQGRATPRPRVTAIQWEAGYALRFQNPFRAMLAQYDRLALSDRQAETIAGFSQSFSRALASSWTPLGDYLASLPTRYDLTDAWEHVSAAYTGFLDQLLLLGPAAYAVLTSEQRTLLAPETRRLLIPACIRALHPESLARAGHPATPPDSC